MTAKIAFRDSARCLVVLAALLTLPFSAYSQVTLTGAMWFASTSSGATSVAQAYADGASNTLGGDQWWNLWLARNPDATSPINGPSDAQASISIPMQVGSYKYYIFGAGPCCSLRFSGLNLFFDGDGSTPGISVFGALGRSSFVPDSGSTLTLQGTPVAGSGSGFYRAGDVVVVLTGYDWNNSATPPGDVCQPFVFSPGSGGPSPFGSFSLRVFPAAELSFNQTSGSPFTKITATGSRFAANEKVDLYAGPISYPTLLATATTDASGSFVIPVDEPQHPVGPMDVYAYGLTSGELGAATLSVISAVATNPATEAPGGAITAYPLGFGAGETVSIYWNEPRQLLGTAVADSLGSGSFAMTVPANASPGLNGIFGVGATTGSLGLGRVWVK